MRKLIVSNFVTLDGFYDGKDKNLTGIFDHYHPDYAGDEHFDHYMTERMRAADTLLLGGRSAFLSNKEYWSGVPNDPKSTVIRREFAQLIQSIDKIIVSDISPPQSWPPGTTPASLNWRMRIRRLPPSNSSPAGTS